MYRSVEGRDFHDGDLIVVLVGSLRMEKSERMLILTDFGTFIGCSDTSPLEALSCFSDPLLFFR